MSYPVVHSSSGRLVPAGDAQEYTGHGGPPTQEYTGHGGPPTQEYTGHGGPPTQSYVVDVRPAPEDYNSYSDGRSSDDMVTINVDMTSVGIEVSPRHVGDEAPPPMAVTSRRIEDVPPYIGMSQPETDPYGYEMAPCKLHEYSTVQPSPCSK